MLFEEKVKKLLVVSFVFWQTVTLSAQKDSIGLRLYLGMNQLPDMPALLRVDSFINSLKAKTVLVKLYGYADYVHHANYNLQLSQQRSDVVKEHLTIKYPGMVNVLLSKGLGEKFSNSQSGSNGDPANRRVDVMIERVVAIRDVDTRPIKILEPVEQVIESNSTDSQEVSKPIVEKPVVFPSKTKAKKIEELSKGESIALEGLTFEPGRHIMTQHSVQIIYKLLKTLEQNPGLKIEIQGHVCCDDGYEDGFDYDSRDRNLSTNRAKAVYEFLVKKGIDPNRLKYRGFGHSKPKVFPEKNPSDEQTNRRVEILILEN